MQGGRPASTGFADLPRALSATPPRVSAEGFRDFFLQVPFCSAATGLAAPGSIKSQLQMTVNKKNSQMGEIRV
jgi:hypothetical protein